MTVFPWVRSKGSADTKGRYLWVRVCCGNHWGIPGGNSQGNGRDSMCHLQGQNSQCGFLQASQLQMCDPESALPSQVWEESIPSRSPVWLEPTVSEERGQGLSSGLRGPWLSQWWRARQRALSQVVIYQNSILKVIVLSAVWRTDCRGQEWKQKDKKGEFPVHQLGKEGGLNQEVVVERGKQGCVWDTVCNWVDRTCWQTGYWMWQEDRSKGQVAGFWPEQCGDHCCCSLKWRGLGCGNRLQKGRYGLKSLVMDVGSLRCH